MNGKDNRLVDCRFCGKTPKMSLEGVSSVVSCDCIFLAEESEDKVLNLWLESQKSIENWEDGCDTQSS